MLLGPVGGPILRLAHQPTAMLLLVNLPVGLSALVLAAIVLPDRPAASENFDHTSLLLSPGLATFLFGVSSPPPVERWPIGTC